MKSLVNPILPLEHFIPDVEAHVWADGRIYLYGSMDIAGKPSYCSSDHHVFSSDDLIHWVDHGVCFSASQITWADGNCDTLYAPDCAYRNGKYYLYYCIPDGRCGVAVSDSPTGPFEDVGLLKHVGQIDPAVFIDDDGQAYLYWGQFDGVRVAKLKDNMVEIDPDTITQPLSVAEHEFHEGSSMKKINGKYYFLYTDTHRHGGRATSMGYAVSDNPMTGFTYGGVIIDNFGCDPRTWNNHGSMECFNGQWYIFYHRSTHCSSSSRHVCIEPITINPDGSINEIKMTTSVSAALPASQPMEACRACEMSGNVRFEGDSEGSFILGQIRHGDTATYRYLEFNGENTFTATAKADKDLRVEVYIDDWYQRSLIIHPGCGYETGSVSLPPISGRHTLTLKFYGEFTDAAISNFVFNCN